MSSASAEVLDPKTKETLAHCVYNGTSDYLDTQLFATNDEAWEAYRKDERRTCTCGQPPREVIVQSHYGGCFYWYSTACLTCMVVTGRTDAFDYEAGGCDDGCCNGRHE